LTRGTRGMSTWQRLGNLRGLYRIKGLNRMGKVREWGFWNTNSPPV